ncbi:restriction endonuclease family protein [Methyloversatilis sp. RAC08]|uniref:restriction endonuclease n=1 Tax=Methyloversatilis sp. RAC08 TaxID=1842540 RepID=UPI00083CE94D|nr:restriction endonuclease [Methyloversatilis sp. RAC08]AOF82732.1 restriction endonuclease family protein [Methyloversatilis sp. RAC08]
MASQRRRGTKDTGLVALLLDSPWYVSVILGVAILVGFKQILPSMWADNPILMTVATALSNMAWLLAGICFLLGALVFVKTVVMRAGSAPAPQPADRAARASRQRPAPDGHASSRSGSERVPDDIGPESIRAAAPRTAPSPAPAPSAWSIELMRAIEWKRFEDLCQKFYEIKGIRSLTTPLGPDGGIDVRLFQDDSGRATSIVQCKAWGERFVGVKPVRELLGVMTHEKVAKAFFMTSSRFSDDAKAFARSNRITLIDGDMFLMMINRLPAASAEALLRFATAGDYSTPTCPKCGLKMKAVAGREGRPDFWGCTGYPRCRQRLGMRRDDAAAAVSAT